MDGYTLWDEASREPEAEASALRQATAAASLRGLWPFLSAAESPQEHEHRLAVAAERIEAIAEMAAIPPAEVEDTARRHFAILTEARRRVAAEEEDDGQVIIVDKRNGAKVAGPFSSEEAHEKLESEDYGVPREELAIEKVESGDDRGEDEEGESDPGETGSEKEASLRRHAIFRYPAQLRLHLAGAHGIAGAEVLDDENLRRLHDTVPHVHAARDAVSPSPRGERHSQPRATRTAYQEGVNPLGWLESMDGGAGSPERPDGHMTQYSGDGSYSEIPMGPPSGPDPAVTGWIDPQAGNNGDNDQGQADPAGHLARRVAGRRMLAGERGGASPWRGGDSPASERSAENPGGDGAGSAPERAKQNPGEGGRSLAQGRENMGQDGALSAAPGLDPMARQVPLTTRPHQGPGGGPAAPTAPPPTSVVGIPVPVPGQEAGPPGGAAESQSVTSAASLIQRLNPSLPATECRRVARKMASRYLAISGPYDDDPQPKPQDSGGGHGLPELPGEGGGADMAEVLPELAL